MNDRGSPPRGNSHHHHHQQQSSARQADSPANFSDAAARDYIQDDDGDEEEDAGGGMRAGARADDHDDDMTIMVRATPCSQPGLVCVNVSFGTLADGRLWAGGVAPQHAQLHAGEQSGRGDYFDVLSSALCINILFSLQRTF